MASNNSMARCKVATETSPSLASLSTASCSRCSNTAARNTLLAGGGRGAASQLAPVAPELQQHRWRLFGFDGQGWIQSIPGLVIGLIALYSSYDHAQLLGNTIPLHRQWGAWFIAASLAVVFIVAAGFCAAVAQLASRSRRQAEDRRIEDARTAAEERECQVEAAEHQRQEIERLPRPVGRAGVVGSIGARVIGARFAHSLVRAREALENPSHPRENTRVIAGTDWVHGQQAARIR